MREKPASKVVPVLVIKQTVKRARRESVLVYTLGVLENIDDHLILSKALFFASLVYLFAEAPQI
jgi:hypothetical protein